MIKRWLIKILFRLIDSTFAIDYTKIDKKAMENWAYQSFESKGFKSYFAYEDLKILKALSFGQPTDQYNILIGRRLQLLYMLNEMKSAFDNKRSVQGKKKKNATPQKSQGTPSTPSTPSTPKTSDTFDASRTPGSSGTPVKTPSASETPSVPAASALSAPNPFAQG